MVFLEVFLHASNWVYELEKSGDRWFKNEETNDLPKTVQLDGNRIRADFS